MRILWTRPNFSGNLGRGHGWLVETLDKGNNLNLLWGCPIFCVPGEQNRLLKSGLLMHMGGGDYLLPEGGWMPRIPGLPFIQRRAQPEGIAGCGGGTATQVEPAGTPINTPVTRGTYW